MYNVLNLKKEINLNGVKLNQLKVKDLMADKLLDAQQFEPTSPEFQKTLVLGAFPELCDDDFAHIYVSDYIRMSNVVESMIKDDEDIKDFLQ